MSDPTVEGPAAERPAVRVIVVTYSPGPLLDGLLDSLPKACSVPYEVVLADNGSTDGAPERAAREHGVRVVRTSANVGYGAAANVGAQGAETEFLLVCNPDLVFAPGAVDELISAAERWPEGGSFGPAVLEPDGSLYPSARALPVVGHGIGHALLVRIWPKNPWTRAYRREDVAVSERAAGWLSGSCLLLRRGHSMPSAASIQVSSCTSRTSTSETGSVGPIGRTSTCPMRGSPMSAARRHRANHDACSRPTTTVPIGTSLSGTVHRCAGC